MSAARFRGKAILTVVISVAAANSAAFGITPIRATRIFSSPSLDLPVYATPAPGDATHMYVVQKRGQIKIIDLTNNTVSATFLDISPTATNTSDRLVVTLSTTDPVNDERGLLGLAFHPNYVSNGFFYVYYYNTSSQTVLARFTRSAGNPNAADTTTRLQMLSQSQPQSNHNGGSIHFGPDGYLYVGLGDGGGSCDQHSTFGNAQNLNTLLGKILRLDVNAASPYIPATNPFVGVAGARGEIWAWGIRNPWRFSFDRQTGDLYIGDVGQNSWEEIDWQPAGSPGGQNYGWRCREGLHCASSAAPTGSSCPVTCTSTGGDCTTNGNFVNPVHEYSHSVGCSISGGYVYRGARMSDRQGQYFFTDYCSGRTFTLEVVGGVATNVTEVTSALGTMSSTVSYAQDSAGELYLIRIAVGATSNAGEIWRIDPNCTGATLSATVAPATQTICAGGTAVFTATTPGAVGTVSYVWRRNGSPIGAPSSSVLTLTNAGGGDAGSYSVMVTDQCNSATSNSVTLTVNPAPAADINADCVRNSADVALFVQVLLEIDTDPQHVSRSDLNGSGTPDGDDINPFVTALLGP